MKVQTNIRADFNKIIKTIGLSILGLSLLSGCGSSETAKDDKVIKVGVCDYKVYQDSARAWAKEVEKLGYKMEIVSMDDNVQLNKALVNGEIDANYHQHIPYLEEFNKANGTDLQAAFKAFVDRGAIFSHKYHSVKELPDGANISLPSDYGNNFRAYVILADAGLIKLKDGVQPVKVTQADIIDNPHHFTFTEVEYPMLPRALENADAGFLYSDVAADNGLDINNPKDALLHERQEFDAWDIIAVRAQDVESEKTKILKKAYYTDAVKQSFIDSFGGKEVLKPAW